MSAPVRGPAAGGVGVLAGLLLAVAAACFGAAPAAAQIGCPAGDTGFAFGPAYLDDVDGGRALGVDVELVRCSPRYDTRARFPTARYPGFQVRGTVPFTDLSLPQNVAASLWYGVSVSLSERAPDDPDAPLDEAPDAFRFHHGFLGLGGRVAYESSGDLDEQALVGGLEVRWVDPRRPLLPSTVVQVEAVKPTTSEVRDVLALDEYAHARVTVLGYWTVPMGQRFTVEAEGAWFWAFGLDEVLEAAGWDDGPYLSGELGYAVGRPLGPLTLASVFVGYAWGQRPTDGDEEQALTLGLELTPGR